MLSLCILYVEVSSCVDFLAEYDICALFDTLLWLIILFMFTAIVTVSVGFEWKMRVDDRTFDISDISRFQN